MHLKEIEKLEAVHLRQYLCYEQQIKDYEEEIAEIMRLCEYAEDLALVKARQVCRRYREKIQRSQELKREIEDFIAFCEPLPSLHGIVTLLAHGKTWEQIGYKLHYHPKAAARILSTSGRRYFEEWKKTRL